MDEVSSWTGVSLSDEAHCRRPLGRALLLGSLKDVKKGSVYGHLSP
jgi:hypothetical protein